MARWNKKRAVRWRGRGRYAFRQPGGGVSTWLDTWLRARGKALRGSRTRWGANNPFVVKHTNLHHAPSAIRAYLNAEATGGRGQRDGDDAGLGPDLGAQRAEAQQAIEEAERSGALREEIRDDRGRLAGRKRTRGQVNELDEGYARSRDRLADQINWITGLPKRAYDYTIGGGFLEDKLEDKIEELTRSGMKLFSDQSRAPGKTRKWWRDPSERWKKGKWGR